MSVGVLREFHIACSVSFVHEAMFRFIDVCMMDMTAGCALESVFLSGMHTVQSEQALFCACGG